jgi:sugar phosphate isomerase/epimerase
MMTRPLLQEQQYPVQNAVATVLVSVFLILSGSSTWAGDPPAGGSIYAKDNLVAWCIVPFDAKRRGPTERAEMLNRLGLTKLAYDWRPEHVPSFEEEILAMKRHGIDFFAFWSPMSASLGYETMMKLIEKHGITPQIWMIAPAKAAGTNQERVEINAQAMLPFVNRAKQLGCKFALYNHGGWAGEPENLIAMVEWLRGKADADHVGIVYNFHHGHEHLDRFPQAFNQMNPYLHCVNLNGMTRGGPKILALGQGQEDLGILKMIRDSGYQGPIGILDHRGQMDAEESLKENLDGLKKLLAELGDREALKTFSP